MSSGIDGHSKATCSFKNIQKSKFQSNRKKNRISNEKMPIEKLS